MIRIRLFFRLDAYTKLVERLLRDVRDERDQLRVEIAEIDEALKVLQAASEDRRRGRDTGPIWEQGPGGEDVR